MTLSNQAKWEITEMETERLKKFYNTCRQLTFVSNDDVIKEYYNVMISAIEDEFYKRKIVIDY